MKTVSSADSPEWQVSGFLETLRERARRSGKRIGFPEAEEERTATAIRILVAEKLLQPVAVAAPPEPAAGLAAVDAKDPLAVAIHLLGLGELDGVVAGAVRSTGDVIRSGLRVLGPAGGITTVSSSFFMALREPTPGGTEVLVFTDAAIVPKPTPSQLAEMAEAACGARRRVVGDEPRVAFLSYSTRGSAEGAAVAHTRVALELFRQRCPDVWADGELQADAALVPEVAGRKAPGSPLGGRANVLVFPDLNAANIAYKLVQRLGGATALGPIIHGLAKPLNDLSRGASVEDIVHVACITALMAEPVER